MIYRYYYKDADGKTQDAPVTFWQHAEYIHSHYFLPNQYLDLKIPERVTLDFGNGDVITYYVMEPVAEPGMIRQGGG